MTEDCGPETEPGIHSGKAPLVGLDSESHPGEDGQDASSPMIQGQIYDEVLQHCKSVQSPQPWGRFRKNANLWVPPRDEKPLLAALQEKYSSLALVQSGVAVLNENQELRLNTIGLGTWDGFSKCLSVVDSEDMPAGSPDVPGEKCTYSGGNVSNCILPLRALPGSKPFDLLTGKGTLGCRLPLYAATLDYLTAKWVQKAGLLFVTFSMLDLVSLRAVRLPAALAMGLDTITPKSLEELCATLGLGEMGHLLNTGHMPATLQPSPAGSTQTGSVNAAQSQDSGATLAAVPFTPHATIEPPRLILVGWMLSELSQDRPGELDKVVRSLVRIAGSLGVAFDQVFVWRPSLEEIRQIHFCLTHGQRTDVTRAILRSLDQSTSPLAPPSEKGPVNDLVTSRARLRAVLLRPGSSPGQRRRRLREFQEAADGTFVEPVLERAANALDPDERSRLGGLAAVNRVLHPTVEVYAAKLERGIVRAGLRGAADVPDTRELMRMLDILYKLTKRDK